MGHWENEEEQDGPVREKGISEGGMGRVWDKEMDKLSSG